MEIRCLVEALHECGIPTWQDIDQLEAEPLEATLRRILADPDTASAIAWITPDVAASPIVKDLEIPAIVKRQEAADGFYFLPVAAGGLDYAEAGKVAATDSATYNLTNWNLTRASEDPASDADIHNVTTTMLRRRLEAADAHLTSGAPIAIDVVTRQVSGLTHGASLSIDLTHLFDGRNPLDADAEERIVTALRSVVKACRQAAPNRPLELRGQLGLPTAVALGAAALAPTGVTASWMQFTPGRPEQAYTLHADPEETGFTLRVDDDDLNGDDLAVLVSISADVTPAVRRSIDLPSFRAYIKVLPAKGPPHFFDNGGQARDLAQKVVEEIRQARVLYAKPLTVHLFIAGPVGFAFVLGQLLNTLGKVHLYEYDPDEERYRRALTIQPSGD